MNILNISLLIIILNSFYVGPSKFKIIENINNLNMKLEEIKDEFKFLSNTDKNFVKIERALRFLDSSNQFTHFLRDRTLDLDYRTKGVDRINQIKNFINNFNIKYLISKYVKQFFYEILEKKSIKNNQINEYPYYKHYYSSTNLTSFNYIKSSLEKFLDEEFFQVNFIK